MTDEAPLDANVVARILRRATDLERMGEVDHPTDGITETSLIAAAEEVVLPVEAVRRSIAYERLGPMRQPRLGNRQAGPAHVDAEDGIEGPAE